MGSAEDYSLEKLFEADRGNRAVLTELLKEPEKNRSGLVPFVGAGLSAFAYPTWASFLRNTLNNHSMTDKARTEISAYIDDFMFEEAAQKLSDVLGEGVFTDSVQKEFSHEKLNFPRHKTAGNLLIPLGKPSGINLIHPIKNAAFDTAAVRLLPRIFPDGLVITTNFDHVLHEVYDTSGCRFENFLTLNTDSEVLKAKSIAGDSHCLIQLHGDIDSPDKMILKKDAYDRCYGSNLDGEPINFFREIIVSKKLLFLGCGLENDRTMALLRKMNRRGYNYAILEMKDEQDGEKFQKRKKSLSDMFIRCIWYPKGKHEFVKTVLLSLYDAFNPSINPVSADAGDCFGREDDISHIFGLLEKQRSSAGKNAIQVFGGPGNGKTTVCRQILHRYKTGYPGDRVYYVDLTDCTSKDVALNRILTSCNTTVFENTDLHAQITDMLNAHRTEKHVLIYLDNAEDALKDEDFKSWFLKFIKESDWLVMYSSRVHLDSTYVLSNEINPLGYEAARKLFLSGWTQKKDEPVDEDDLRKLLTGLNCHPLTIKLVTAQHRNFPTIQDAYEKWNYQYGKILRVDDAGRHRSLQAALKISYDAIKDEPKAPELWAVMSLLNTELHTGLTVKLFGKEIDLYLRAADCLNKNCLLSYDGKCYKMLNPIKDIIFAYDKRLLGRVSKFMHKRYTDIFKRANRHTDPNRQEWHNTAVSLLPSALGLLRVLQDLNGSKGADSIMSLVEAMHEHFQYNSYESFSALYSISPTGDEFTALLCMTLGRLENRLGKSYEARENFKKAEKLYNILQNELGLADVLKAMGDLDFRLGMTDSAGDCYQRAKEKYIKEGSNFGLANTLKSIADLELHLGNKDEAKALFEEAGVLFENDNAMYGIANVLKSLGDLSMQRKDIDAAEVYYLKALALFEKEKTLHGQANALKSMGDLELNKRKFTEADEFYAKSEQLYLEGKVNHGLADVLKARGDLATCLKNFDAAEEFYEQAERRYKNENAEPGLALVYKSKGDLKFRQSSRKYAKMYYLKAIGLFEKANANYNHADALVCLGELEIIEGNDEAISGIAVMHFEEAGSCFKTAGELFRKENAEKELERLDRLKIKLLKCADDKKNARTGVKP